MLTEIENQISQMEDMKEFLEINTKSGEISNPYDNKYVQIGLNLNNIN